MWLTIRRLGVLVLAAGVLAGCKTSTAVQPRPQNDPLCCSKKPVEGKPREADPEVLGRLDPPPPPVPTREGGVIVRQRVPLGAPLPLPVGYDGTP